MTFLLRPSIDMRPHWLISSLGAFSIMSFDLVVSFRATDYPKAHHLLQGEIKSL